MFRSTRLFIARHKGCYLLQAILIILSLLIPFAYVYAQGGVDNMGTGGKHKIQGRIYFPSGRRSDATAVKVTLDSSSSESLSVIADLNGSFTFNSIAPGSYTVTVDAGKDYEIARESVYVEGTVKSRTLSSADIERADVARIFNVIINLRLKAGGDAGTTTSGVLNAALANAPKQAVDFYQQALESANAGDSKKAIEQLKAAVSLYPEFALALNEMGVQYLKIGQPDKAIEPLSSSLKIKPDEFVPRLNYGIALLEKKETVEAETQLRMALKKNDASSTAHMYLGLALLQLSNDARTKRYDASRYAEAQKELERAISLGKNEVAMAHRYLGGIYWGNREYK
ncbi:MAG TPA: tetratricopeptide repeat protein, partial [Pyrinomonadaceae bacterium]|nr:tetratricopeptide repeat protein [Pyrinomonadaceae bacterium]